MRSRFEEFNDIQRYDSSQLVSEYAFGIGGDIKDDVVNPIFENVAFDQTEEQQSWSTIRQNYDYLVEDAVEQINSSISARSV